MLANVLGNRMDGVSGVGTVPAGGFPGDMVMVIPNAFFESRNHIQLLPAYWWILVGRKTFQWKAIEERLSEGAV